MGRIVETINKNDGHIYYVIQADGKTRINIGIEFLDGYDNLVDHRGEPGLFFVRQAGAKTIMKDGEPYSVQNGDPTVHSGWALYCWDNHKNGPNRGDWRKVAEQESVDGPWGIDELILNMLVKKVEFNMFVTRITEQVTNNTNNIKIIQQNINSINDDIESLKRDQHNHINKAVLDLLGNNGGMLTFNGRSISGNYLYEGVVDGVLYWTDPTFEATEENPEFTPIAVDKSSEIADYFIQTSLAAPGLRLEVLEVDGSISSYDIIEVEGMLTYRFRESTHAKGYGTITYVSTLPEANIRYDNRGIWCPLMEDGVYTPNEFYISKYGEWVTLASTLGKGSKIGMVGAECILAYTETDPDMPFKKNHLIWNEPSAPWQDAATLLWHSWGKTTLVRKFGSVPMSIDDGTIVMVNTTSGVHEYVDTCPYSNEEAYYQLFSETKVGAYCTCNRSAGVVPQYMSWTDIFNFMERHEDIINLLVKPGDTVVLPEHPKFGKIEGEVLAVTSSGMTVVTKNVLDKSTFGPTSLYDSSKVKEWLELYFSEYTKYVKSKISRADGRTLKIFDDEVGFVDLNLNVGDEFPEGVDVYEANTENVHGIITKVEIPSTSTIGFDNISREKHFDGEKAVTPWWTANAVGGKVATGDNANGVDPSEENGLIVVFTLGKVAS